VRAASASRLRLAASSRMPNLFNIVCYGHNQTLLQRDRDPDMHLPLLDDAILGEGHIHRRYA